MKGLLYKDWSILIGQYRKNIFLVLILYLGMAYLFNTPFMLYALVFMFGIYTQSAVSFDESSHWDMYAHTLPIHPAAVVGSKYLLGLPISPAAPWAWRKHLWACWQLPPYPYCIFP